MAQMIPSWVRTAATTMDATLRGVVYVVTRRSELSIELKAGDAAPPFVLEGSDGRTYRLSDFVGRRAVVIAWFPKAFTGG